MRRSDVALLLLLLPALAAGCSRDGLPEQPWRVNAIDSPAGDRSGQPQLSSSGERTILSWVERSGSTATLKFAERTADGWSEPRVAATGDDWFVNWADVPSVVRLDDGTLAAHWLEKSGSGTYAYDVRIAFSRDDGRTWSESLTPHHDGTQTEHGFASLFQAPGAGLGLVWLDGRHMGGGHDGHEGHGPGAMTLRAATFDPAGRQVAEVQVDDRVCECCPTAIAVTADGPIAAFRNRTEEEVRDIYITRLVNGAWTEPVAVHADNWRIPACPVNGPALAARGREVVIAWFTMAAGKGQVHAAFSSDSGATFGPPIRVDDGSTLGRVDVAWLENGAAAVSWVEMVGEGAEFRVRRVAPDGTLGAAIAAAGISATRSSGYPRLARHQSELILAWTAESQVHTASILLIPNP